MSSLVDARLESNSKIKINFDGGDLSSDTGLFLLKEFVHKVGFDALVKDNFKTNDPAKYRHHKDNENLLQEIYQTIAGYFQDDDADEFIKDLVFNAILNKDALTSQPTMSRFFNRMDKDTLDQYELIHRLMRQKVYSIERPDMILLDIDSTLFETYGSQEGQGFNYHYSSHGYHPLLCYDGFTGDLLKAQLRNGNVYTSNGVVEFLRPLLTEYMEQYPDMDIYLRGDSGFAVPGLYSLLEQNACSYAIRIKANNALYKEAAHLTAELDDLTALNKVDYAVCYGEFEYQAGTWDYPRRVVAKVEKPTGQMLYMYTFIVTNMDLEPQELIRFYCNRGRMENFIKESKNGFKFGSMSSGSKLVNANRLQISMLAYNIFNWFRRLTLPGKMRKYQVDTIRLKLIKIASRIVRGARYITFKLCSSCAYKEAFYQILANINGLQPQLE
ncbi:MAG: IS1380 family transposase [Clostridiaceae bacterium]|nr:IS1380 family transposase [Clostridiaceae bacterium]